MSVVLYISLRRTFNAYITSQSWKNGLSFLFMVCYINECLLLFSTVDYVSIFDMPFDASVIAWFICSVFLLSLLLLLVTICEKWYPWVLVCKYFSTNVLSSPPLIIYVTCDFKCLATITSLRRTHLFYHLQKPKTRTITQSYHQIRWQDFLRMIYLKEKRSGSLW